MRHKTTKTMDLKFRGRDKYGVWHYGFLNYSPIQTAFFIHVVEHTPPTMQDPGGDVYSHSFEIDPETVGQHIGFPDQNERYIYKDDVLLVHQFLFDGAEIEKEFKGRVVWIASVGSYGVKVIDQMDNDFLDYTGYENLEEMPPFTFSSLYGLHEESFEVIGNIHDNPELLNND